ncbi:MAG TPA: VCBS repeat-containing protein, partial [Saprospiraceae bacterium]
NFKELYSFFTTRSTPYDNFPVTSIAFGDIDNDGTKNIVATNGNLTYIFSTSFQLLRTINLAGGKIILGNVDQDAAVESIYAGGQIIQYSVSGQVNDFKFYPANHYETVVRLADMNLDGVQDVIYSSRDSVHMVDVKTQTRVRSIKKSQTSGYISDFQVYDQTLDGIPDLFVANDGGQQDVHAYDGATGAFNYTIHEFPSSSVKSLAVAPLDDEPGAELFLIIRSNFLVYDLDTHAKTWKNIYRQGDIRAFDAGNIGGTGGDELVIGSFDDVRGSLERRKMSDKSVIAEIYDPFFTGMGLESYSALKIGDVDDDGIDEIVLGIESGHRSETRAYILDKNFNVLRYYEVDGMSLISDIAIEDVDNDGQNEIILTCGTNVTGSTDPAEWQNFIYILDGATGSIEWQSQKIGIVGSRIGNIRIGNVDNDPALEILALRFENEILPSPPPVLYIIDAATHNVIMNMNHVYTSFDIYDTDNDGIKDIVAGTKGGSILALDGETLAVKATIASGKGKISSLIGFDVNADGNKEIVYTNSYRLIVYDPASSSTIAHSDTLDNQTGRFASLRIFGNSMEEAKIFVTTNNALHEFRITPKVNSKPAGFNLIAPVDHEEILSQTPLEFSWEMSLDDDAITYEIEIAGSGLDTLITDIESMEITIPTSLFELNVPYTWSVSATDGYDKTKSAPFVFTMVNERPANFNLIMPLHEAVLLGPEMVAFSWESSQDTDPISYTLSVVGSGL